MHPTAATRLILVCAGGMGVSFQQEQTRERFFDETPKRQSFKRNAGKSELSRRLDQRQRAIAGMIKGAKARKAAR
jgi:hypothetical protein